MTDSPAELGNTQALNHMLESMRKGQLEITHDGNPIGIGRKLGTGGTKTVYQAAIGDGSFAFAVPNVVDGVEKMSQKWTVALQEPANTARVRDMGLLTNTVCDALPVSINGVPFTGIKMALYQDLPYQIMDGKNSQSSTVTGEVLPATLDGDSFEDYFENIVPDVQQLIRNGVRVGVDSINVCLVNGEPRLFLSDLGNADFEEISEEAQPRVAERYISHAFSAFLNGLTYEEYQKHKDFFDSSPFKFNNPDNLNHRLAAKVMQGIPTDKTS